MKTGVSTPYFDLSHFAWILLTIEFCVGLWVSPIQAAGPAEEVHHYREVTGKSVKEVQWRLKKGDGFTLYYTSPLERHTTTVQPNYDTFRWQVVADGGQTDFTAERQGNTIILHGRFKGKSVNKTLKIDGAPWYQATSLSLRPLAVSDNTQQVFWTIRFKTLEAHKIKAVKKGVKSADFNGGTKKLQQIRLTLPGFLAPFWKSDYWFSLPECIFYRFKGRSGPPGAPMTIVTRVRKHNSNN